MPLNSDAEYTKAIDFTAKCDKRTGDQAYLKASKNPAKFCHDFAIFREKPYQALFLKSRGINR
ncbi:hypothetical protein A1359_08790 [Methylomonas lenta]|uniref:Uncharacterized protein n=1 Tax=Methylomonas lenta TaxID=980561 RepID=A0A177NF82_9GAMM|nr:hypothetical protein [Methylomonas lenta]OAI16103.1 hypothetical protein A1359_08790 [Methylomonas lenta]